MPSAHLKWRCRCKAAGYAGPNGFISQRAALANGGDGMLQVGALVSMEQLEGAHIRKVLERTSNLAEAAQVLGIDQATLYRKRKKIGLE